MTDRTWDFETAGRPSAQPLPAPPTRPPVPPTPAASVSFGPPVISHQVVGYPTHPAPSVSDRQPVRPPTRAEAEAAAQRPVVAAAPRWGWRALVAFLAGGALAASGFAVAQLADDDETLAATPVGSTATSITTSIAGSPPDLDTAEPVAFVAALLGPSVVQIETDLGTGSGVIYAEGRILTNHHVIENASQVRVRLSDGRTLAAEIVGSDPRTDIAVISAGEGRGLPVAALALDNPPEVGELTIAIGSPFQLQQTVTSGIVSAVNRPIFNGRGYNAMVQTDAAINPGNSGGALANRAGEVIGLNTAIQTDGLSNTNAGIGFAVPITTAVHVAERIVSGESLDEGFLGVLGGPADNDQVGVQIETVTDGSAAQDAGIQVGDLVVSVDGAPVTVFQELAGLIQTSFPGEQIDLVLIRDGQTLTLTVTLGER